MSRTPIHEALMMLKGEWLVDVLPQRGSIVSKISIQYINEGYAMRKMLEPALLRSLSGHLNQAQLSELHGLLEQQDGSACISHDVLGDYFITLDNEFHKRLYTYAGYDRHLAGHAQRYYPHGSCALSGHRSVPDGYGDLPRGA